MTMPEDNIITITEDASAFRVNTQRKKEFDTEVKQFDEAIQAALAKTTKRMWQQVSPTQQVMNSWEVYSIKDERNSQLWEALWFVLKSGEPEHGVIQRLNGQTKTDSYPVLFVSLLSGSQHPLVLAVGKPIVTTYLSQGNVLLSIADGFRAESHTLTPTSLNSLLGRYTRQGPSLVTSSRTIVSGGKQTA